MLPLPDMFHAAELTNVINLMPNKYSVISDSGMFPFMGMSTNVAAIQRNQSNNCLVVSSEWCAPPKTTNRTRSRDLVFIPVPHTPIIDSITGCEINGRRGWDLQTSDGLMSLQDEMNIRLAEMRGKLEQTVEYRVTRAIMGEVLDADGSILEDLFERFNYTPKTLYMDLDSPNFVLRKFAMEVKRWIENNYTGQYTEVRVMLNGEAMDKLTNHKNVVDIYKRCCDTMGKTTDDVRDGFSHAGVTFWEYGAKGCYVKPDGEMVSVDFLAPPLNEGGTGPIANFAGVAYPFGTTNSFELLGAPPTMNEYVNRKATQLYYASAEPKCHNEGYDLKMQMNAIPISKQPLSMPRIVVGPTP
jgi:Phage major capsid protein E